MASPFLGLNACGVSMADAVSCFTFSRFWVQWLSPFLGLMSAAFEGFDDLKI